MLTDAIGWALPELRAEAEQNMTSTCRIFTKGAPVTDPTTGVVTYGEQDAIATPCRVRPNGGASADGDSGGAELIASGYVVSVPFSVASVAVLQRVVITASLDPSLVGLRLEVRQVARGDNITARRLLCEEVA